MPDLKRYSTTKATSLSAGMTSGDTAVNLIDGSTYPDPAVGGNGPYTVIIGYGTDREEICTVTAKPSTHVLTVTRAQDGSAAVAKNIGDTVVHGVSKRDWDDMLDVTKGGTLAGPLILDANPTDPLGAVPKQYADLSLPKAGGTMTGLLTLSADPTSSLHAATKQYVDDSMPIASIIMFGSATPPTGWLLCNGQSTAGYTALAAVVGANTPDLRDRFVVGAGSTYAQGNTGGAASVTLTAAQSGVAAHSHSASSGSQSVNHTHTLSGTTGSTDPAITMSFTSGKEAGNELAGSELNYLTDGTGLGGGGAPLTADQGAHSHSFSATTAINSASHQHAVVVNNATATTAAASHENRPPYYALTFIIKAF